MLGIASGAFTFTSQVLYLTPVQEKEFPYEDAVHHSQVVLPPIRKMLCGVTVSVSISINVVLLGLHEHCFLGTTKILTMTDHGGTNECQ